MLAHTIDLERGRTRPPDGRLAEQLSKWLKVSPSTRNVDVLRAIKDLDDEELAFRLLVAGISVSEANNRGADDDGVKNFRATAEWIGRNLGQQRGELCVKVGAWGINRLIELPIFGFDAGDTLKLTASADDIMDEALAGALKNNPFLSPLTEPPQPWTQVRKGGLPAHHWAKVPLIREHHSSIERAVRKAIADGRMHRVVDAINALQAVPFTINLPVLDFMSRSNIEPPHPGLKPPVYQRKKHEKYVEALSQRSVFISDMTTAKALACAERFYVPLNMDFRGRIYGIPHFNFAREDRVRALFPFADGEPIGEEGLWWLKAHVAARADGNAWSRVEKPSKLTRDQQVAWTDSNLPELRHIGEAVLRREDPANIAWALQTIDGKSSIDSPYQFLAACVELVQALEAIERGLEFITRLPLTVDGSCNGLQHLCAMTRAKGARYVNLTKALEVPPELADDPEAVAAANEAEDFYRLVAFLADRDTPGLMDGPFDRKIVKQPAMSYFYGSRTGGFAKSKDGRWRAHGMTRQVLEILEERRKGSQSNSTTQDAKEIAKAIYKAIGDMVPSAKAVMTFLRHLTRLYAKEGKHLRWTSNLGQQLINCYYEPEEKDLEVKLLARSPTGARYWRRRTVTMVIGDTNQFRTKKAVNSAPANYVHSLDADHLKLVALAAKSEGIAMVSVHDCFGSLAPRFKRFNAIIREQFEVLHEPNLLEALLSSARANLPQKTKLPKVPECGTYELKDVRSAPHSFK